MPIEGYPASSIDVVFYLEGDSAKRHHNEMLTRPGRPPERWHYTVSDRYGLYVCKDYIPLPPSQRVNAWVAEKSEWTLYHAFVNCQDFELTANRGSIGNTDRHFLTQVREAVENLFKKRIKVSQEYQAYEEEIEFTKQRGVIETKGSRKEILSCQEETCRSVSAIEVPLRNTSRTSTGSRSSYAFFCNKGAQA